MGLFGGGDSSAPPFPTKLMGPIGWNAQHFALASLFEMLGGKLPTGGKKQIVPGTEGMGKKGKGLTYKQAAKMGLATQLEKGGKGVYKYFGDDIADKLFEQFGKYQEKATGQQVDLATSAFDKMFGKGGPSALKNIAAEAAGKFPMGAKLNAAFGSMFEEALGPSTFAKDPNVEQFLAGPLALQKVQMEQSIKKGAESQALGMAGFAQPPINIAGGMFGGIGVGNQQNLAMQAGQLGLGWGGLKAQTDAYNTDLGMAQSQNKWSALMALGSLGMGGMGGGAGAGPGATMGGQMGPCWVAEELYGRDHLKTRLARSWCVAHPRSLFVKAYTKWGRAWARCIRRHAWLKPLVRWRWDMMWRAQAAGEEV